MATNVVVVVLVGTACCYQIFNYLKLFHFSTDQYDMKFRQPIGDNILDFVTVSDF